MLRHEANTGTSEPHINLPAYPNTTNRDNFFTQPYFAYKTNPVAALHTVAFGTEFGQQTGVDIRNTGIFPNGTNTIADNPFAPTYFGPVTFVHQYPGALSPGVTSPDSNSSYRLNIESAYARDTVEITRWIQLIGGARFDRFDMADLHINTGIQRTRIDDKVSPQSAVILKTVGTLSISTRHSIS